MMILEVVPNVIWSAKIRGVAKSHGVTVVSPKDESSFRDAVLAYPVMALVDVAARSPWDVWISRLKGERPSLKAVAFGDHVDVEGKRRALDSGADHYIVRGEFPSLLPYLMEWAKTPHSERPCLESLPPGALRGIELMNEGKYFEQHEVLERVWKSEHRPIRDLYQGLLLMGVGCLQVQRVNREGAIKQLEAASLLLGKFLPACQGVAVEETLTGLNRLLDAVQTHPDIREVKPDLFPTIRTISQA